MFYAPMRASASLAILIPTPPPVHNSNSSNRGVPKKHRVAGTFVQFVEFSFPAKKMIPDRNTAGLCKDSECYFQKTVIRFSEFDASLPTGTFRALLITSIPFDESKSYKFINVCERTRIYAPSIYCVPSAFPWARGEISLRELRIVKKVLYDIIR